jgi:hypothetical protein
MRSNVATGDRLAAEAEYLQFLASMETNPEWATQFSDLELVEKAGTQGVELLMWLAMRAALRSSMNNGGNEDEFSLVWLIAFYLNRAFCEDCYIVLC